MRAATRESNLEEAKDHDCDASKKEDDDDGNISSLAGTRGLSKCPGAGPEVVDSWAGRGGGRRQGEETNASGDVKGER